MTINFVTVNQSDKLLTQIKGLSARVFPLRACGISRRNYVLNKSFFLVFKPSNSFVFH